MRSHWGSKLGFILASAGSAIGLGNIWRFPYLAGLYGGGIFLLAYLVCVGTLGYFLLTAKLTFGRTAQTNLVDGFRVVGAKAGVSVSPIWGILGGWLGVFNALLVAAVYVVVIGWTASYVFSGGARWLGLSTHPIDAALFQELTGSFLRQLFWGVCCIVLTSLVIIKGVKKGIERVSLWLMPILFVLLLFMVLWMIFLPGTERGILFFLRPDLSRAGWTDTGFDVQVFADLILAALGQAIYSLSLGMGVMFIYGSYLSQDSDIKKSARWIVGLDTLVAVLSGLIVMPAVFAFDLEPTQGPGLSFISLPLIFEQMTGGRFLMFLFFVLLFLAALTSLISIYEAIVSLLIDKLSLSRPAATGLMAALNITGVAIVLASMTEVLPLRLCGKNLFDFMDKLTGSFTINIMVFVCCLFMGWRVFPALIQNLGQGSGGRQSWVFRAYLRLILRWLVPLIMLTLFVVALS